MRIDLVTLFPGLVEPYLAGSIVGRAREAGLIEINAVDPRRWAGGRHRMVDDRPYGGGPGMVLAAPPIARCIDHLATCSPRMHLMLTSPQGRRLDQPRIADLAASEAHIVVLCGHYEGIDERIVELYRPEEFSIGDLVLSGGELAALILADAVTRLIPGALGHAGSAIADSFSNDENLLDHPCYTRPVEFRGLRVPAVLQSGDHAAIEAWRLEQRRKRTAERRPDLGPA